MKRQLAPQFQSAIRMAIISSLLNGLMILMPSASAANPLIVCASGCGYTSIQTAINAATSGDTVTVAAGIYTEQININKSLTLTGAGTGATTIQAPGVLTSDPDGAKTLVLFTGPITANFSGFTVQGPVNGLNFGIYVRAGATANIHDNIIKDIRDDPLSGAQIGVAIEVGKYPDTAPSVSQTGTATITSNHIYGYQKTGIAVEQTGSRATITGNTITGAGPITTTAQNGIQIRRGATGTIKTNTVTGNAYDGPIYSAEGIGVLHAGSGVVVQGNTVNHNAANIYSWKSDGIQILDNQVSDSSPVDQNASAGITVQSDGTPSCCGGSTGNYVTGVTISGNTVRNNLSGGSTQGDGIDLYAVNGATVSGNTVMGASHDGILVGGSGNTAFTSNQLSGNGLVFADVNAAAIDFGGQPSGNGGANTLGGFSVHNNSFVGNRNGIWNYDSGSVDATNNWWGSATGPGVVGPGTGDKVSTNVTYNPWYNADTKTTKTYRVGAAETYSAIQTAVGAASSGDTVSVATGTYNEVGQIVINKNLTIVGADKVSTIIKPAQDTSAVYYTDSGAWILVNSGVTFNLTGVTLDGTGRLIANAIFLHGSGTIDGNIITNIAYNQSSDYLGFGIRLDGATATISNNSFSGIGREGVSTKVSSTATITGNTYTGKGAGNWLDYAFEVGRNSAATISGNVISGNTGVASDGSTSAGILVTTYFDASGVASGATITNNTLTGNTDGIKIGYDAADTSVVVAHHNNISGNTNNIVSTHAVVDATHNWWGSVVASTIAAGIAGSVTWVPYYRDSGFLHLNTHVPSIASASITGTAKFGFTLTAGHGVLTGSPTPSLTYAWSRDGVAISGATNSSYVLVTADLGKAITVAITASNGVGSDATATSVATAAVGGPDHTVTFNANGGTGTMASQTTNVSTALTANSFTLATYDFTGWTTLSIGGTSYANGSAYAFAADVTLYAHWTLSAEGRAAAAKAAADKAAADKAAADRAAADRAAADKDAADKAAADKAAADKAAADKAAADKAAADNAAADAAAADAAAADAAAADAAAADAAAADAAARAAASAQADADAKAAAAKAAAAKAAADAAAAAEAAAKAAAKKAPGNVKVVAAAKDAGSSSTVAKATAAKEAANALTAANATAKANAKVAAASAADAKVAAANAVLAKAAADAAPGDAQLAADADAAAAAKAVADKAAADDAAAAKAAAAKAAAAKAAAAKAATLAGNDAVAISKSSGGVTPVKLNMPSKYAGKTATVELGIKKNGKWSYSIIGTITLNAAGDATFKSKVALPKGSVISIKVRATVIQSYSIG